MSIKSLCEKYFGSSNFYEVLGIDSDASEKEIKKAYHRMSLLVHPDRVDEDQKEEATEKFKTLGKIHSILQDKEKRKVYDDVGEFDEETESTFDWMNYWRNLFKSIDIKDIDKYKEEYIGSETEKRDIKKAYIKFKGDMNRILELVDFSNCESEPRIIEIVRKMVDDGEVEEYKSFFNENKQKKLRRHKKWEKEKQEAEQIDMAKLEKEMEENSRKRCQTFENLINGLEAKYAPKKKRMCITDGSTKKKRATRKT